MMTSRVSAVSQCVQTVPANGKAPAACAPTDPKAPANVAGIRPGDRIISMAGQPVTSWDDVRALVRPNGGRSIAVVVERNGKRLSLAATPILTNVPQYDAQGKVIVGSDGKAVMDRVGFMGFSPSAELVKQPITAVPALIGTQIAGTAGVVLKIPQKMAGVARAAFGDGARDPSLMSVVGVGRVAGEVADGQLSGATGSSSGTSKLVILIGLIASLNIALFVFNLIPLMPLDGGHVAGALWEGLKRQMARLRGRPDPGYVDVAKALPVTYVVSIALIGMSVLLMYADLVNPIKLGG
jgi:membrane-associated protease RseP (regulator of RpoE activity)